MALSLERQIAGLLKQLEIHVSYEYLQEIICTHPDYPSLACVTDTLDQLGIENAAIVADKERVSELPIPFLAHTDLNGGEFVLIRNARKQIEDNTGFKESWSGIALVAEKPPKWEHEENSKRLRKERKNRQVKMFLFIILGLLSFLPLLSMGSWHVAAKVFAALAGLAIAILLAEHELGISNPITEQLCSTGNNSDCDAVLQSGKSKLFSWLNLSDVGLVWFASILSMQVVALFTAGIPNIIPVMSVMTAAALPFTVVSIYYQWRVIKKWCPLCLLTLSIIWLQFGLYLPSLLSIDMYSLNINSIGFTLMIFTTIGISWIMLLKPLLTRNLELKSSNYYLLRFKRSTSVFMPLLKKQRQINTRAFDQDLQLGDAASEVQVMVGCSLFCMPCAKTHLILHDLIKVYNIGVTVRFQLPDISTGDKKIKAAEYIFQLTRGKKPDYKLKVLHDWYEIMDLDKFSKSYVLKTRYDVSRQLEDHRNWSNESQIRFTPTVFLNGHEIPAYYSVQDLEQIIKIVTREKKKIDKKQLL